MARHQKEGLDYFPLDTDFFSDEKVKILKARYGTGGISLYLYVLCRIYRNGYYLRYNEDFNHIVAEELHMSIEEVQQVMTFLFSRSLLVKITSKLVTPDTIITGHGIQRRFQSAVKTRAQKTPVAVNGAFWLLSEEETERFIKVRHEGDSSEKKADSSEKKADSSEKNDTKESKVNTPLLSPHGGTHRRRKNSFNNFSQRDYNYDQLEKLLAFKQDKDE